MTSPRTFNRCVEFLLDQIYTSENAKEADKNGNVRSGEMICHETAASGHKTCIAVILRAGLTSRMVALNKSKHR